MSLAPLQNLDADSVETANADSSFDFAAFSNEPTSPALESAMQALVAAAIGPPDADILLSTVRDFIQGYVSLSKAQATICAAWVLHTWTIKAFSKTPYLLIESPEAGCGKSTMLKTLRAISFNPLPCVSYTPAALIRAIDAECRLKKDCSAFLDEIDNKFKPGAEGVGGLTEAFNYGFERGNKVGICDASGKTVKMLNLDTFSIKVLAGISGNSLPGPTRSRCLPIKMNRMPEGETLNFDSDNHYEFESRCAALSEKLKAWATPETIDRLRELVLRPKIRANREGDLERPLLAIADDAGEIWPQEVRSALDEVLAIKAEDRELTLHERMLADTRSILEGLTGHDSSKHGIVFLSRDIVDALNALDDAPWINRNRGEGINADGVAWLLKPYGIRPMTIRLGDKTPKAYRRADFESAWTKYLSQNTHATA